MTDKYETIIQNLRNEGKEAHAQEIEELLGRLYEAEETLSQWQSNGAAKTDPEVARRQAIAARAYFDRRLIKPW